MTIHLRTRGASGSSTDATSEIDGSPTTGDLEEPSEDRRGFSLRRRWMPLKVRLHRRRPARWRRQGCARAQELTFLSLSSLLLFFSLRFSHFIRSCFSLVSAFDPFLSLAVFFVPRRIPWTPVRRDVTAITGFLSLLLSLSHTRLLRSTVLSLTRSHGRGCEKSSMGPTGSLFLFRRDNDDDWWGRPTSGSILTACVYALVYRVLLLLCTHPSDPRVCS